MPLAVGLLRNFAAWLARNCSGTAMEKVQLRIEQLFNRGVIPLRQQPKATVTQDDLSRWKALRESDYT